MDDAEFDERLRNSAFLAQQLFDVAEGASVTLQSLLELLITKGVLTVDDVMAMLKRDARDFSQEDPSCLVRRSLEATLRDFELFASSDVPALLRRRHERRRREGIPTQRRPQRGRP